MSPEGCQSGSGGVEGQTQHGVLLSRWMDLGRMDLGRLPELMHRLAGFGTGITITPVMEEGRVIGGLESSETALYVAGWKLTYETRRGSFTVRGKSIPEAVDAALANGSAW
jgi:hypothetical protein